MYTWLQTLFSTDENLLLLSKVLKEFKVQQSHPVGLEPELDTDLTTADFLKILTTPTVIDTITEVLTKQS